MSMTAFDWTPAWDQHGEATPFPGLAYYELPDGTTLHEGDSFWDTEQRHLVTVSDVKTKVYTGTVGFDGEEGTDHVFYDTDWSEPKPPNQPTHWTDDIQYVTTKTFAARIGDGRYVPHRGNGAPRVP